MIHNYRQNPWSDGHRPFSNGFRDTTELAPWAENDQVVNPYLIPAQRFEPAYGTIPHNFQPYQTTEPLPPPYDTRKPPRNTRSRSIGTTTTNMNSRADGTNGSERGRGKPIAKSIYVDDDTVRKDPGTRPLTLRELADFDFNEKGIHIVKEHSSMNKPVPRMDYSNNKHNDNFNNVSSKEFNTMHPHYDNKGVESEHLIQLKRELEMTQQQLKQQQHIQQMQLQQQEEQQRLLQHLKEQAGKRPERKEDDEIPLPTPIIMHPPEPDERQEMIEALRKEVMDLKFTVQSTTVHEQAEMERLKNRLEDLQKQNEDLAYKESRAQNKILHKEAELDLVRAQLERIATQMEALRVAQEKAAQVKLQQQQEQQHIEKPPLPPNPSKSKTKSENKDILNESQTNFPQYRAPSPLRAPPPTPPSPSNRVVGARRRSLSSTSSAPVRNPSPSRQPSPRVSAYHPTVHFPPPDRNIIQSHQENPSNIRSTSPAARRTRRLSASSYSPSYAEYGAITSSQQHLQNYPDPPAAEYFTQQDDEIPGVPRGAKVRVYTSVPSVAYTASMEPLVEVREHVVTHPSSEMIITTLPHSDNYITQPEIGYINTASYPVLYDYSPNGDIYITDNPQPYSPYEQQ